MTGFNDGRVPAADRGTSAHLSESTAEELGLPGRLQRTARDAHALAVLAKTHEELHLVTGRRSAENDPLLPSRLLFHTTEDEMLARVRKLVDEASTEDAVATTNGRAEPARARPVPRHPHAPSPARIRVTAFRDYLESPYLFYLRHVLKAESVDDAARELDGRAFGKLAHEVLEDFAPGRLEVVHRYVHVPGLAVRVRSEAALEDLAVVADHEAHDAGVLIARRPCQHGKAAEEIAVDHIAVGPARGVGALRVEQLVVISVVAILAGMARSRAAKRSA